MFPPRFMLMRRWIPALADISAIAPANATARSSDDPTVYFENFRAAAGTDLHSHRPTSTEL